MDYAVMPSVQLPPDLNFEFLTALILVDPDDLSARQL
jgi:hypothetical protein